MPRKSRKTTKKTPPVTRTPSTSKLKYPATDYVPRERGILKPDEIPLVEEFDMDDKGYLEIPDRYSDDFYPTRD